MVVDGDGVEDKGAGHGDDILENDFLNFDFWTLAFWTFGLLVV